MLRPPEWPRDTCGVLAWPCSRNWKRTTRSARTTANGLPSRCRKLPTRRSPKWIGCSQQKRGKSSRFEGCNGMSKSELLRAAHIDAIAVPRHVAIIMDGNGRWAAARGLPRAEGHRRGVEALRRVVRAANELGILYLTIFSFSSENWSRPATEIGDLFGLLRRFIRNDLATLHRDGVRGRGGGGRDGREPDICALLSEAEDLTRSNTRLTLVVAFNYGSRQEIANAAQRLAREVAEGRRDPASIDADALGRYLDAPAIPAPHLIIRTSGEQRLSNFLMWQAAYSELVFVPIHWPDFDKAALEGAIAEYARRERRFGGLAVKTGS